MFVRKIGIDLGTANVLVFVPGKGIVVNEPSVVAVSVLENKVLAVGNDAKDMLGRTPDTIVASRPMKDGVIADYKITEAMLKYFINNVSGKFRLIRPEIMISLPVGVTSTERRAVIDAAVRGGAKAAYVVREPVLAAIGAGIPINSAAGNMIIDIGGGTSEVAVISLGGVVAAHSARVGGNRIDQAIADYIKRKYSLAIGDRTAEDVKIKIGSAMPLVKEDYVDVRGRDLTGGLPKTVHISSNEVTEAIQDELLKKCCKKLRQSWRLISWTKAWCSPAAGRFCAISTSSSPRPSVSRPTWPMTRFFVSSRELALLWKIWICISGL